MYLTDPMVYRHPREDVAKRSDFIVPDAEQLEFREMRGLIQGLVDKLDSQGLPLDARSNDLREKYTDRLRELQGATAAYKKLPPELLLEIFSHAGAFVKGPVLVQRGINLLERHPWTFSHVCSRWRQVLASAHSLWDDVCVNEPGYYGVFTLQEVRVRKSLELLALAADIVARGTRFLDVRISQVVVQALPPRANPLGELIIPFASQFKTISLECSRAFINPLISSSAVPFSQLESFTMCLDIILPTLGPDDGPYLAPFLLLANAPNLRTFRFQLNTDWDLMTRERVGRVIRPHTFSVPWAQITELELYLHVMTIKDAHALLSLCTSLQTCSLHARAQDPNLPVEYGPLPEKILTLPYLTALRLFFFCGPIELRLFKFLLVPSLKSLELDAGADEMLLECLQDLMQRSRCVLQKLKGKPSPWIPNRAFQQFHDGLKGLEVFDMADE